VQRIAEEDGGAAVTYHGILNVADVRYSLEVLLFADLDSAYSVATVWQLVPVEWSVGMRAA
jgi:hypothetical protein